MTTQAFTFQNLWNGMSTQPDWNRFSGQLWEVRNWIPRLNKGLQTRWGTCLRENIVDLDPNQDYLFETINDDTAIVGKFADSPDILQLRVYGPDGFRIPVRNELPTRFAYLGADINDLLLISRFETLLIINRSIKVKTTKTSSELNPKNKSGGTNFDTNDYYDLIKNGDTSAFDPATFDAIYCKLDYNDFPHGWYRIVAQPNPTSNHWARQWEPRPAKEQVDGAFDATTMPHQLRKDVSGFYNYTEPEWAERTNGDEITNPPPPLTYIRAASFHSGRLFLGDDTRIYGSRTADFFNFFQRNINVQTDDDPIIRDITETNTGELLNMVPLGPSLVLQMRKSVVEFSSFTQDLTPTVGRFRTIARVPQNPKVLPTKSGLVMHTVGEDKKVHRFVAATDPRIGVGYAGTPSDHIEYFINTFSIHRMFQFGQSLWLLSERLLPVFQIYKSLDDADIAANVWKEDNFINLEKVASDGTSTIIPIDLTADNTNTPEQVVDYINNTIGDGWHAWRLGPGTDTLLDIADFNKVNVIGRSTNAITIEATQHLMVRWHMEFGADGSIIQSAWWMMTTESRPMHLLKVEDRVLMWLNYATTRSESFDLYHPDVLVSLVSWSEHYESGGIRYDPPLDRREYVYGSYDDDTGLTAFDVRSIPSLERTRLILQEGAPGQVVAPDSIDGRTVYFAGDYEHKRMPHIIGETFRKVAELPRVYAINRGGAPSSRRTTMNRISVFHDQTSDYELYTQPEGRKASKRSYSVQRTGLTPFNVSQLGSGSLVKTGAGNAHSTKVWIEHKSAGTAVISSLEVLLTIGDYQGSQGTNANEITKGEPA